MKLLPTKALQPTIGLLLCWRDGITISMWIPSANIQPTEFFSAFVVIFFNSNFIRLHLSANEYKMPAQQQAAGVSSNTTEISLTI